GNPTRLETGRRIRTRAYLTHAVLLAGLENGVSNGGAMFPGTEDLPSRLPDHPMTQRADVFSGNFENVHIEESHVRHRPARDLLHDLPTLGTLNLIPKDFPVALVHERSLVPFRLGVVLASFHVVLHPVVSRRTSDEVELVFAERKQNAVAHHVPIRVAGHELLGLIDPEILETVDAEIGKYFQRIRAFDVEVGHVVRQVQQRATLAPRALLVPPVRELGTHDGKRVGTDRRISQQFDWTLDAL